jgi:hypothetical protein
MKLRPAPTTKESDTSDTTAKPATKSLFNAWHELIAPDDIIEVGRRLGVIKRQRKVDLPALVAATIGAVSPVPGSETSALVNYLQLVGVGEDEAKIAVSSFYHRYSEEFAALMRELALRARVHYVARKRVGLFGAARRGHEARPITYVALALHDPKLCEFRKLPSRRTISITWRDP